MILVDTFLPCHCKCVSVPVPLQNLDSPSLKEAEAPATSLFHPVRTIQDAQESKMRSDLLSQLPILLRLLADPRTPHTVSELWCRIFSHGWEECEPLLLDELKSGDSNVQRLVIEIIEEHAANSGIESIQSFVPSIVSLLGHNDRLVRSCAISAVGELMVDDQTTVDALRHIVCTDEPLLASAAFQVLLGFDPKIIEGVAQLFRDASERNS